MQQQSPAPLAYGKIANAYDAFLTFSGFRRGVVNFLDRIELPLPPAPRILDAGCGTGLISRYLIRRLPDAHIMAADIDRSMLAEMERLVTKEGLPKERFLIAEGDLSSPERIRVFSTDEQVAVSENSFDGIFVSGALEYVPLQETIRRLVRLLRPGGLFFNLGMRRSPAGAILSMMYGVKPYRIAEMRDACESAGLADIQVLPLRAEDFPANLSRVAITAQKR